MIHSRKKYSYLNSSGMAFELSVTVQEMNQRSIFSKALQLGHIRDFVKEIKKKYFATPVKTYTSALEKTLNSAYHSL